MSIWDEIKEMEDIILPEYDMDKDIKVQLIRFCGGESTPESPYNFTEESLQILGIAQLRFAIHGESVYIDFVRNEAPHAFNKVLQKMKLFIKNNNELNSIYLCDRTNGSFDIWGRHGFSGKKHDDFRIWRP